MGNEREAAELGAAIIILPGVNFRPSERSPSAFWASRQGRRESKTWGKETLEHETREPRLAPAQSPSPPHEGS